MRYSRQEILIGKKNQKKISQSTICIVGIGALGTVAAEILARAGVGKIILIDRDFVELNNLQRQSLFDEKDIGKPKAVQAKKKLEKINGEIKIISYVADLDHTNVDMLKSDLILGCTDNLESRFLIDEYCSREKIPWIYGAAIGTKGYVMNIIPNQNPFKSIFRSATNLGTCSTEGILNTSSYLIGTLTANEAIKNMIGKEPEKSLIYVDILKNEIKKIIVTKNHNYEEDFAYLSGKKDIKIAKLCGSGIYQFKDKRIDYKRLKNNLSKKKGFIDSNYCFHCGDFTAFIDGRVFIKAEDEKTAKSKFNKLIGS